MTRSRHTTGLLLAASALLVFSPESLIIRSVTADTWAILAARGLVASVAVGLVIAVARKVNLGFGTIGMGRPGWTVAGLYALSTPMFIVALRLTEAATVLVVLATGPLFAAVMARLAGVDRVPAPTWVAAVVVVSVLAWMSADRLGTSGVGGVAAALAATVGLAASFVVTRRAREVALVPALAVGHGIAGAVGLAMALATGAETGGLGWIVLDGAVIIPVASTLLMLAPRYLPAAEVALLLPIETVLGSLWVWLGLGEAPPPRTAVGGTVVLAVVVWHSTRTSVGAAAAPA